MFSRNKRWLQSLRFFRSFSLFLSPFFSLYMELFCFSKTREKKTQQRGEMATANSVMALIRAYRPSFRNPYDKIAFALHASFLAAGYVLTATGNRAFSDAASSLEEEVGIDGWNALDDCYGFIYKKVEKGTKKSIMVKCSVKGKNLVVDAMCHGEEQKKPVYLQINVNYWVSDDGGKSTNYAEIYKNLPSLIDRLQSCILDKLENTPKCESASTSRLKMKETSEVSQHDKKEPSVGLLTEFQRYSSGSAYPPVFPVRSDDLYPGPAAGVFPSRGGFGIGGDMLVGPNDPRWHRGLSRGQPGFPEGPLGVPPGSRFDPIGPPNVPGFEPECFIRYPRSHGGGGHPDTQHFPGGHGYYL